jgi:hypothetical protein
MPGSYIEPALDQKMLAFPIEANCLAFGFSRRLALISKVF